MHLRKRRETKTHTNAKKCDEPLRPGNDQRRLPNRRSAYMSE
jgi:hypothetical protein